MVKLHIVNGAPSQRIPSVAESRPTGLLISMPICHRIVSLPRWNRMSLASVFSLVFFYEAGMREAGLGGFHMRTRIRRRAVIPCLIVALCSLLSACGASSASSSVSSTGTAFAGTIAVTLDKTQYASGDTISATILNGLDHTIYAADHETDCTTLVVEHQTNSGWERVGRCLLASVTRLVPFAAGSQTLVPLDNGPAGNGGASWGTGTYRVSLTYLNSDSDAAAGTTVYSATFTLS